MAVKVLVVDDEEDYTNSLAQRLETRSFEVCTAYNGDDAITRVRGEDFDVIILDVLMPGKTGIEALREIKQLRPITEVIMLTGHATVETAIEGMKLGAYDYLMKPTEIEDLVEKITKAHARKAEHEDRIRNAHIKTIVKRRGW